MPGKLNMRADWASRNFPDSEFSVICITEPLLLPKFSRTFGRSQGTSTSSSAEQDFKTNGLENFRKNLVEKGISNTAANRISNSRRSGTTANYQSIERQIDPVLY